MLTIAVLTALGHDQPLRSHVRGALNLGLTQDEIVEIITHTTFYAGIPRTLAGLKVAKEIFDQESV